MGLGLAKKFDAELSIIECVYIAKKFDAELSIIECVYKIPPKFYFFETKSDKKIMQKQIFKLKEELKKWKEMAQKEGIKI
jgi:hypothetical protein